MLQADAAAGRGRVLSDEDRMAAVGRLPAVVVWLGGGKPVTDQFVCVPAHTVANPRCSTIARSRPLSWNFARKGCCPIRSSLAFNSSINTGDSVVFQLCWAVMLNIQLIPNWSTSEPASSPQTCISSGRVTVPPTDSFWK